MAPLLGNGHHSFWLPKYYNCNISEIINIFNSTIHTFEETYYLLHHCSYEPAKFEYSDHLLTDKLHSGSYKYQTKSYIYEAQVCHVNQASNIYSLI